MSALFEPNTLYMITGAILVAAGLYGFITRAQLIRRILAFNIIGSGIFLLFGAASHRDGATDPVPQAMIITGIVVALSLTAFAAALAARRAEQGGGGLAPGPEDEDDDQDDTPKDVKGGAP